MHSAARTERAGPSETEPRASPHGGGGLAEERERDRIGTWALHKSASWSQETPSLQLMLPFFLSSFLSFSLSLLSPCFQLRGHGASALPQTGGNSHGALSADRSSRRARCNGRATTQLASRLSLHFTAGRFSLQHKQPTTPWRKKKTHRKLNPSFSSVNSFTDNTLACCGPFLMRDCVRPATVTPGLKMSTWAQQQERTSFFWPLFPSFCVA